MNTQANAVLDSIRKTLQTELEGTTVEEGNLTEEEQEFCTEARALIAKLGFQLEGYEDATPEELDEVLAVIRDEDADIVETVEQIDNLLSKYFES